MTSIDFESLFAPRYQERREIEAIQKTYNQIRENWIKKGWVPIPVEKLKTNWWNFNEMRGEDFALLCSQIARGEILRALVVREIPITGEYEIIDGEQKFKAAKREGFPPELPCEITKLSEMEAIQLSWKLNLRGKKNPEKFCRVLWYLWKKKGMKLVEIAELFNLQKSHVSERIKGYRKLVEVEEIVKKEGHLKPEQLEVPHGELFKSFRTIRDCATKSIDDIRQMFYYYAERTPEEKRVQQFVKRKQKEKGHPLSKPKLPWGKITCPSCDELITIEWDTDESKYVYFGKDGIRIGVEKGV